MQTSLGLIKLLVEDYFTDSKPQPFASDARAVPPFIECSFGGKDDAHKALWHVFSGVLQKENADQGDAYLFMASHHYGFISQPLKVLFVCFLCFVEVLRDLMSFTPTRVDCMISADTLTCAC